MLSWKWARRFAVGHLGRTPLDWRQILSKGGFPKSDAMSTYTSGLLSDFHPSKPNVRSNECSTNAIKLPCVTTNGSE